MLSVIGFTISAIVRSIGSDMVYRQPTKADSEDIYTYSRPVTSKLDSFLKMSTYATETMTQTANIKLTELRPGFAAEITGLDFANGVTEDASRFVQDAVTKVRPPYHHQSTPTDKDYNTE